MGAAAAIDYSAAGAWAEMVRALAMVETGEKPAMVGDGGQAIGLLQQHPAFFSRWYGRGSFAASVDDTWAKAQIKSAAAFLEHYVDTIGLDLTIQAYNQGEDAVMIRGKRAPAYLARFDAALNKLRAKG